MDHQVIYLNGPSGCIFKWTINRNSGACLLYTCKLRHDWSLYPAAFTLCTHTQVERKFSCEHWLLRQVGEVAVQYYSGYKDTSLVPSDLGVM